MSRDPLVMLEAGMFAASGIAAGAFLGGWVLVGGVMIALILAFVTAHLVETRRRQDLLTEAIAELEGLVSDGDPDDDSTAERSP